MLGQDQGTTSDEMWDEIKTRAITLIEKLEAGDLDGATSAIEQLNEARDHSIYLEVGKLTRGLHDAIRNFDIETPASEEQESKMTDAQHRLDYVINLTQNSADKTMDMVEQGIPVVTHLGHQAGLLKADWDKLIRREIDPQDYPELYQRVDQFLTLANDSSTQLSEQLNTILLAQDFQDLTGQVIKKVIALVQEVEERLVDLMRVAGQVEELTGIISTPDVPVQKEAADSTGEGPQIHAETRDDVVSGQDDVDDLLSSLGF